MGPALLLALLAAPTLSSVRTSSAPIIDGRLDDVVWLQAVRTSSFTQKTPEEQATPGDRTELLILHDRRALYLGLRCSQARAPVLARLTRRDRAIESDRVVIDIDPNGKGRSAYHFEVNAAGVLSDAIRFETKREDDTDLVFEWDEVWVARTQTSSVGWTAEIEIPFRVLRFAAADSMRFGLEVRRYVSARAELDEWSFIPKDTAGEMLHYGTLVIDGPVDRGGALELAPVVLGEVDRADSAPDRFASGLSGRASAGLDAEWHIAEDLTLDLSVNPDFAQVEADQVVLNLTSFELLLPEKRRFFLEGLATFDTPLKLLYTRRVGQRAPEVDVPSGAVAETPGPAPIWGALKLVGRPLEGMQLGTFFALTGPVEARLRIGGELSVLKAAPITLFSGLRLFRELPDQIGVGMLLTGVSHFEGGLTEGACPSGATASRGRCTHDAYALAADLSWHSPSGGVRARGQLAASLIAFGPARTLLDGSLVQAGDIAPGGFAEIAKEGGNWLLLAQYHGLGRRFDVNDAGFLERQNLHRVFLSGGYRDTTPGGIFLEHEAHIEVYRRYNADGLSLAEGYQLNHAGHFQNQWGYFAELHLRPRYFDDREIGDGRALERAGLVGLELYVESDRRLAVTGQAFTSFQVREHGVHFAVESQLGFHGVSALEIGLDPTVVVDVGETRYAGLTTDGAPSFAALSAFGVGATFRLSYTFAPSLTVAAYAQPFLELRSFAGYRAGPAGKRQFRLDELGPGPPPESMPDTTSGDLNLSVVLRWEYLPGSTLYVVYARAQHTDVDPGPDGRVHLDFSNLGRGPAIDTLLVKLSYWWSL